MPRSSPGLRTVPSRQRAGRGRTGRGSPGRGSGPGPEDSDPGPGDGTGPAEGTGAGEGGPDPAEMARQICLRLLAESPRTRAQLHTALRRRRIPDEVAQTVLGRFAEVG